MRSESTLTALFLVVALASLAAPAADAGPPTSDGTPYIAEISGVDLSSLDADQRERATRLLNATGCDCGCGMSLARCRRDDRHCPRSPVVAPRLVRALAEGKDDEAAVAFAVAREGASQPSAPGTAPSERVEFDVTPGDAPAMGAEDPTVTVISWLDYQ